MSEKTLATLHAWLIEPMESDVAAMVERARRMEDVRHVAIMPDVHLANDVTVGTVMATSRLIYPQAVGGDIGCGMLALAFDVEARDVAQPAVAGKILAEMGRVIPGRRRHRAAALPLLGDIAEDRLSHPQLSAAAREDGRMQLGTLGGGNHFVELQSDEEDRLWLMIHSGSRNMGQLIRTHHLAQASAVGYGMKALDAESSAGQAYLNDVAWARRYAAANRLAMAREVAELLKISLRAQARWEMMIAADHNHVAREAHDGQELYVHRKGAMPADAGMVGVLPGSMGTLSFHVEGLGCPVALRSSAHGAGRRMSREVAKKSISRQQMQRQMEGVWFDYRRADLLRDESPKAYKDVRAVVRAQKELVKVVRTLNPVVSYKAV
jgi:tRNA-splicing ligase RtcB (3'-phosphate/5'-hydroxy nucleic acid ligase)